MMFNGCIISFEHYLVFAQQNEQAAPFGIAERLNPIAYLEKSLHSRVSWVFLADKKESDGNYHIDCCEHHALKPVALAIMNYQI